MARHAKSASATPGDRATADRRNSAPGDPMINVYAWWLDQAGEWSNEAFRFANRRLRKDLEAAVQLMKCDDSNQALALQARFANDLAADYLDEGKKMLELMAHAAAPQSGSTQRHARRAH
jgi:Phasin protein